MHKNPCCLVFVHTKGMKFLDITWQRNKNPTSLLEKKLSFEPFFKYKKKAGVTEIE